jgi:hypothetical protein
MNTVWCFLFWHIWDDNPNWRAYCSGGWSHQHSWACSNIFQRVRLLNWAYPGMRDYWGEWWSVIFLGKGTFGYPTFLRHPLYAALPTDLPAWGTINIILSLSQQHLIYRRLVPDTLCLDCPTLEVLCPAPTTQRLPANRYLYCLYPNWIRFRWQLWCFTTGW